MPELPGVNMAAGLKRAMGNEELYQRLLARFGAAQRAELQTLRAAVRHGDRKALGMITHTLKGVAANIGATRVAQAAQDLESRGRNASCTQADLEEELSILESELEPLLTALEKWRPAVPEEENRLGGPAGDEYHSGLLELETLLRTGDTRALDCVEKLRREETVTGLFGAMERALLAYDFETALLELQTLRDSSLRTFPP